jgi:hypothetical protein
MASRLKVLVVLDRVTHGVPVSGDLDLTSLAAVVFDRVLGRFRLTR